MKSHLWIWCASSSARHRNGIVEAVDPRDAVSRALTSEDANGQLIGQVLGIPPSVLDRAPGNFDTHYVEQNDEFRIEVMRTDAITIENHPAIVHPYRTLTLEEALRIVRSIADLWLVSPPATLEAARQRLTEMVNRTPHMWITGLSALDLLDAVIDGRALHRDCRVP